MMARAPGSLLLHPLHLIALATLGVNDHWLKTAWPGPVTGKLSDAAGLVVLPVVVVAGIELIRARPIRWPVAAAVAAISALGFAAVQIWPTATRGYAIGLGWIQWVLTGADGTAARVSVTPDPTDLLTLPAAVIPVLLAARSRRRGVHGDGHPRAW